MNIRRIIAALALVLASAGANAQDRYVSQEAAAVLGSDKYYILMAGEQSGGGMAIDLVMEAAAKGSSAMTRMSMGGFQDVTLYSGGTTWIPSGTSSCSAASPASGTQTSTISVAATSRATTLR